MTTASIPTRLVSVMDKVEAFKTTLNDEQLEAFKGVSELVRDNYNGSPIEHEMGAVDEWQFDIAAIAVTGRMDDLLNGKQKLSKRIIRALEDSYYGLHYYFDFDEEALTASGCIDLNIMLIAALISDCPGTIQEKADAYAAWNKNPWGNRRPPSTKGFKN